MTTWGDSAQFQKECLKDWPIPAAMGFSSQSGRGWLLIGAKASHACVRSHLPAKCQPAMLLFRCNYLLWQNDCHRSNPQRVCAWSEMIKRYTNDIGCVLSSFELKSSFLHKILLSMCWNRQRCLDGSCHIRDLTFFSTIDTFCTSSYCSMWRVMLMAQQLHAEATFCVCVCV